MTDFGQGDKNLLFSALSFRRSLGNPFCFLHILSQEINWFDLVSQIICTNESNSFDMLLLLSKIPNIICEIQGNITSSNQTRKVQWDITFEESAELLGHAITDMVKAKT